VLAGKAKGSYRSRLIRGTTSRRDCRLGATLKSSSVVPNGHGPQPLYEVEIESLDEEENVLDVWRARSITTIVLDRH